MAVYVDELWDVVSMAHKKPEQGPQMLIIFLVTVSTVSTHAFVQHCTYFFDSDLILIYYVCFCLYGCLWVGIIMIPGFKHYPSALAGQQKGFLCHDLSTKAVRRTSGHFRWSTRRIYGTFWQALIFFLASLCQRKHLWQWDAMRYLLFGNGFIMFFVEGDPG